MGCKAGNPCTFELRLIGGTPSMTLIGIVLGGATTVTDRVIHKIPNWLAVCLYGIALILMIAGLVVRRKAGA